MYFKSITFAWKICPHIQILPPNYEVIFSLSKECIKHGQNLFIYFEMKHAKKKIRGQTRIIGLPIFISFSALHTKNV